MSKVEVTVDNRAILAMFDELDAKRRKQVYRQVLNASASILVRQAKQNLRGVKTKSGTLRTSTPNRWNGKTLESGIRRKISKDSKEIKVHVMSDFRLKFFEMGTKDRTTKGHKITGKHRSGGRIYKDRAGKGGYRGRIIASRFFQSAKQSTERPIFDEMENRLLTYVQRINAKYANR